VNSWIEHLYRIRADGEDSVLVTVAAVRGSAPREAGAKMIVTSTETIGTIGGGQLEYQSARIAVARLNASGDSRGAVSFRRFRLGAGLGQCCGGVVDVMFERISAVSCDWLDELVRLYRDRVPVVIATGEKEKYLIKEKGIFPPQVPGDVSAVVNTAREIICTRWPAARVRLPDNSTMFYEPVLISDFDVAVFGAGHVGTAVVEVLARLDCNIRWVDSRRNIFPQNTPRNVVPIESARPERDISAMPAGSFFLIVTHSHPLDYEICGRVLRRDDFAWCGLIGSKSKRRRFENLMRQQGMSQSMLRKLTCPIGIDGVSGKTPAEIAISVSAQLLQVREVLSKVESPANRLHVI
jgi:xanthine dehydrogenase accessory factor